MQELEAFFRMAHWPKETERRPTFFSIAGFPHYENVMSNVYQFLFETDNPHGLGSLCLDALLDVVKSKGGNLPWTEQAFRRVYAKREIYTDKGKRLDILLHNGTSESEWQKASCAILIENKVYHFIANDLEHYRDFVDAQNPNCKKINVVMGLKAERLPQEWIYVTHIKWAEAVEARLGPLTYRAESRYLTLLLELIENIRTMSNATENYQELLYFFRQNRLAISKAETIRLQVHNSFPEQLQEALLTNYKIYSSKYSSSEGWLDIHNLESLDLRYSLGYWEVFHEDGNNPNCRITLLSKNESDTEYWRNLLSSKQEALSRSITRCNEQNCIVAKTYELSASDFDHFPQFVADRLKIDWQPLEEYWLKSKEERPK